MEEEKTVGLVETFDTGELSTELIMMYSIRRQINTLHRIIMQRPSARKKSKTSFSFREISG